ncbi:MAG: MFS transporter, partial [Streptosporangiaceae bacterium]
SYFVSLVNKVQHFGFMTHRESGHPGRLRTPRAALCAVFAVHGFVYASWAVRIPAIKQQAGASSAALGLALLGLSAGAVATMMLAGALGRRFGAARLAVLSCVLLSGTLLLPPQAHSAVTLGLALLVFGGAYGCLNVAMNTVAVDIVAALRRPVMPGFHAAWSFGGLAGAAIGGLVAPHLSPARHLLLVALAGLLVTVTAGPALLTRTIRIPGGQPGQDPLAPSGPAPDRRDGPAATGPAPDRREGPAATGPAPDRRDSPAATGPAPDRRDRLAATGPAPNRRDRPAGRRAVRTARVVGLFGLIALCAAYDEGAIGDWGALHLRQDLGASAGLAATGYAAFALAEACGRLSGTWLLERLDLTRVLVLGGLTACAGMLLASLAPDVGLALAGFAATGLGLANLFPAAMTRAGLLAGSSGIALAATLGYTGFLLGPPAIGFLASEFSLRAGLTTLSFLALAAAVIAYRARGEDR